MKEKSLLNFRLNAFKRTEISFQSRRVSGHIVPISLYFVR